MNKPLVKYLSFMIRGIDFLSKKNGLGFLGSISKKLKLIKQDIIFRCIDNIIYANSLSSYEQPRNDTIPINNIIWSVWWQGEEEAPFLVKKCFESIRNCNSLNLIVVTKDNYKDYVNIPDELICKLNADVISNTSFSELLRLQLLVTYGGLWVDATIYFLKENKIRYSDYNFFCLKGLSSFRVDDPLGFAPVFYMYSKSGYSPLCSIRDIMFDYWMVNNFSLDYFFIDYVFKYKYMTDSVFRTDCDNIPLIGKDRFLLNSILSESFNPFLMDKLKSSSCPAFKLSNKVKYLSVSEDGSSTFYFNFFGDVNE